MDAAFRFAKSIALIGCLLGSGICLPRVAVGQQNGAVRARRGLQVLYDFRADGGSLVRDRSGVGTPLDLRISDPKAVRRTEGALEVRGNTLIKSEGPAAKIVDAVRRSGALTVEVWIRPSKTAQSGPARIVTLSKNSTLRNFTLGQDSDRYDLRLRTTKTSFNGIPSVSSPAGSLGTKLTHVVTTRNRAGSAKIYVNAQRRAEGTVAGDLSKWDGSFQLALCNELTGDRPWLGTYHLVAIYSQELSANEVTANFRAGAGADVGGGTTDSAAVAQRTFETRIAPLLVDRCFECHDSATKKGRLDLSRKETALAGGESGKVIVPGKSAASLLWKSVAADDMPKDRPPMTEAQKKLLRTWIDAGATWSLNRIDPAVYAHGGQSNKNFVRRLTVLEYVETVRSAVGVDIEEEARRLLPTDLRADGFSNTAYNLSVDLKHVQAYARLAEIIVGRMDVEAFAARFSRSRKLTDNEMRDLIGKMGQWIYRGPLDEHEIVTLRGISTTVASSGGDFPEAVRYVLESMLQSPRFVYRMEDQRGDGSPGPIGGFELASRMSYILWGGPPDAELMRAAESGALLDRSRVESQVRRMLKDPRAVKRSLQFASEWLDLGRLENMRPDRDRFPKWDARLAVDMRDETLAFFEDVVWKQNRPLSDLFNAPVVYATPRLARHYGFKPQAGDGMKRYDAAPLPGRGGLLTQGSVLTVGGDDASMVTRGLFVLHDLLRGVVRDPPPCVDTTPVPTKPGRTQRGIAELRIANAACGGCHSRFEPLAFGLEKFDGLGFYRNRDEHGNELRDDGEILFPGSDRPVAYKDSTQLMDLLAASPRVRECLTWKVAQFAMGRPLGAADVRILDTIHTEAQRAGGTYSALITAIVMSDLVQLTRTETIP